MTTLSVMTGYWRNLDKSDLFQGHRLADCIGRIHDDVLKIWNFNDPSKVSVYNITPWEMSIDVLSPVTCWRGILKKDVETRRASV